jgi:tRNA-splicing ligase RtcB (3'-phosphate/5'-hydroxy nucleic acid ligase)
MMRLVRDELDSFTGRPVELLEEINCHHNLTEREHHMGQNVWVPRKGAIRAGKGDRGVIPGSMGAATFIVSG